MCGSSCNTHYVSLTTFYLLGPDLDNGGGVLHAPAEVVLVVLAADHGHGAVLTQATALLKFLEQLQKEERKLWVRTSVLLPS